MSLSLLRGPCPKHSAWNWELLSSSTLLISPCSPCPWDFLWDTGCRLGWSFLDCEALLSVAPGVLSLLGGWYCEWLVPWLQSTGDCYASWPNAGNLAQACLQSLEINVLSPSIFFSSASPLVLWARERWSILDQGHDLWWWEWRQRREGASQETSSLSLDASFFDATLHLKT